MADGGKLIVKIDGDAGPLDKALRGLGGAAQAGVGIAVGAIAAVGTALVAGGVAAYKFGTEYETSLAKVGTIADTTKSSMEELSGGILKLSTATGEGAAELNEALYQSISAGVDTGKAVSFVGDAVKLAKGGFTDTTTAVDVMTTALNAYSLESDQATRISDILITTQNKGKTTVGELSAVLGRTIPTAAAFGVELEDLGASFAILTANGIKTNEAGTYLNGMLSELGKSGTKASDALKNETGKTFQELMNGGMSLGDVIGILGESAEAGGVSLLDMFGSLEAGKAALTIANAGAEEYNETLQAMYDSAGATDAAFETMANTTATAAGKIGNNFKNLGILIFQDTSGAINEVVTLFAGMSERLTAAFEGGGLDGLFNEFGNVLAELVVFIAEKAPDFIESATNIILAFIQGLSENQDAVAQGASDIVIALADGIVTLFPEFIRVGSEIAGKIFTAILDAIKEKAPGLSIFVDAITAVIDNLDVLLPIIVAVTAAFAAYKAVMAISGIISAVSAALNGMTIAQYALNVAMSLNPIGIVIALIAALVAGFIYLWNTNEEFRNALITAWETIKVVAEVVWGALVQFFTVIIPQALQGLWEKITGFFSNLVKTLQEFPAKVVEFVGTVQKFFSELPEKLGYIIGLIIGKIVQWGVDLINWVVVKIPEFVENVRRFFAELPEKIGAVIILIIGKIVQWGVDLITWVTTKVPEFVENVRKFFAEIPGKIWTQITSVMDKVRDWGTSLMDWARTKPKEFVNNVIDFFKQLPDKVVSIGRGIVEGLWSGITGAASWLWGKISGFVDSIVNGFKEGLQQNSPAKRLIPVGEGIDEGIGVGLDNGSYGVLGKIKSQTTAIVAAYQNIGANIGASITSKSFLLSGSQPMLANAASSGNTTNTRHMQVTFNSPDPITEYTATRQLEDMEKRMGWAIP